MTTTTDLATRRNGSPASSQPSTAVAIRGNQVEFDDKQRAALVAMGVSPKVTRAELAVFFHQCRNLRLDPFSKQIYLIHRRTRENGEWIEKPTTQIGIDGFRVTRDRICEERDLAVSYEETIWYNEHGEAFDVWLWDEPPAACKFTVLVDDGKRTRRFPSVLRFNEYCQKNKDGDRLGRWKDGHSHQIEKCAEADALRRAFPNDLSGVILEDAAPLDDPDAPPRQPRVTAEEIRNRAPQRPRAPQQRQEEPVDAVVVDDGGWPEGTTAARPEPAAPADARSGILLQFDRLKIARPDDRAEWAGQLLNIAPPASLESLTGDEADRLLGMLAECQDRSQLEAAAAAAGALLRDGTATDGQ